LLGFFEFGGFGCFGLDWGWGWLGGFVREMLWAFEQSKGILSALGGIVKEALWSCGLSSPTFS
jgi:hypothetical protein